jgi:5-methylcytosine-specific restriction protein A
VVCVLCKRAFATVADHWPTSRRELVEQGVTNPDAPSRLRGLCGPCHSRETANNPDQAGGWNRR